MDCSDGALRTWRLDSGNVQEVHRHRSLSYGVAWWQHHACSGGRDGEVLCTSPEGTTQTILSSSAQIRWIVASPDHQKMAIATIDGKLYGFDGSLRMLYKHDAPPYRMSISPNGQLLASGADDGSLKIYDFVSGRVVHTSKPYDGRVMSVIWRDNDLWTASVDGVLTRWLYKDLALIPASSSHERGAIRFMRMFKQGWVANIDSQILLVNVSSPAEIQRFDLGRHIAQINISPDERYIAATISGEVAIIDLHRRSVATLGIAYDGIGYVGFARPALLAISTANGLHTADVEDLKYVAF